MKKIVILGLVLILCVSALLSCNSSLSQRDEGAMDHRTDRGVLTNDASADFAASLGMISINDIAAGYGKRFTDSAQALAEADLRSTFDEKAMARYASSTIINDEERYIRDLSALAPDETIDSATYKELRSLIFMKIIDLNITSLPPNAEVQIGKYHIGKTPLKKPFKSEKEYTFIFKLPGYKILKETYKVKPYPSEQTFNVHMMKEEININRKPKVRYNFRNRRTVND